jgi:hypothetical protein
MKSLLRLASAKSTGIQQYFSLTTNQQTILSTTTNQRNEQADTAQRPVGPEEAARFQLSLSFEKYNSHF